MERYSSEYIIWHGSIAIATIILWFKEVVRLFLGNRWVCLEFIYQIGVFQVSQLGDAMEI